MRAFIALVCLGVVAGCWEQGYYDDWYYYGFEGFCDADRDCPEGCYCDEGVCAPSAVCQDDSECSDGFVCWVAGNTCVPEDRTGDVGDGGDSGGGNQNDNNSGSDGGEGNNGNSNDNNASPQCFEDVDCDTGEQCVDGVCDVVVPDDMLGEMCTDDVQCGGGQCRDGLCFAACVDTIDCGT
ncbi:MAG: hypothetical protein AAF658_02840, partial [Myxococcota bacterium]